MDVQVDPALCEANARCVSITPEVFALDDDEILHITLPAAGVDRARIELAVASCPLTALSLPSTGHPTPSPDHP